MLLTKTGGAIHVLSTEDEPLQVVTHFGKT
jgi:hypothetical protein